MHDELIERLRMAVNGHSAFGGKALVNPHGPEAADTIEAQAAEIERLRERLYDAAADGVERGEHMK